MDALFENYNPLFEGRNGNWDVDLRNFLEYYLQELHNETSCSSMINFSQAAIVLQKTVNIYERKVDYLWQLVMQLLDVVKLSKTSTDSRTSQDDAPKDLLQEEVEVSTSKKTGRRTRSNKPYLLEEFNQIKSKVSAKSLDLPSTDKTSSQTQHTLTRSAVFGRMVNIKKKRQHELYVFDKNDECMGKKDDFRLSWSLNHCCTLVEDPSDESIVNPPPVAPVPPVAERLSIPMSAPAAAPMDCDPVGGVLSPISQGADDDGLGLNLDDPNPEVPNPEVPNPEVPNPVLNDDALHQVPLVPNPDPSQETLNQEVPVDSANPLGEHEVEFALPDTPPDTQQLEDAPAVAPSQEPVSREDAATPRLLRDRNLLGKGDAFNPINYLFSKSLLESLDDTSDENSTYTEKVRLQAERNRRKGKRRFQEILEEDGDLVGFEDIEEPGVPDAPMEPDTNSAVAAEEIPAPLNVPGAVPTPPPTPSNSQAMSPTPATALSDVPGTPRRSPDYAINMFDPYRSDETEQNDRSARVAAWHKSIKQKLEEANARPPFDVHVYGSKVINAFPCVGTRLNFEEVVTGMDKPEIARIFLTSLMLANTKNVEITLRDSSRLPVDCISLSLLSTQRHEEELEAFCAPSVDTQRRSNTESAEPGTSGTSHRKRKHDKWDNYASSSRSVPSKKVRPYD